MDAHKKVLLVGASTLVMVTEAALKSCPELTACVVASPAQNSRPWDAIVVVDWFDDRQMAALAL